MDKKLEPPAEDDCPGRSMPGASCADAKAGIPTCDLADPCSHLVQGQLAALRTHTDVLMQLIAGNAITGELRVEIVSDERMSQMHKAYKDTPGTTDVLTFDLAPDNDALLDADILICADEAARQADQRAHDVVSELMLYIIHAVLHCTGYDDTHDNRLGITDMHNREDEILASLGLGAVFHSASAEDGS